jgi:hypothetical protein
LGIDWHNPVCGDIRPAATTADFNLTRSRKATIGYMMRGVKSVN